MLSFLNLKEKILVLVFVVNFSLLNQACEQASKSGSSLLVHSQNSNQLTEGQTKVDAKFSATVQVQALAIGNQMINSLAVNLKDELKLADEQIAIVANSAKQELESTVGSLQIDGGFALTEEGKDIQALEVAPPAVISGAVKSLKSATKEQDGQQKSQVAKNILGSSFKSLKEHNEGFPREKMASLASNMVGSAVANLKDAGLDKENAAMGTQAITSGAMEALASAGIEQGAIIDVAKAVVTGAVSNLPVADIGEEYLASVIGKATEGAVKAIKVINTSSEDDKLSLVGALASSSVSSLKALNLPATIMVKSVQGVSQSAVSALGEANIATEKLGPAVQEIAGSMVKSLSKITSNADIISETVGAVASGAIAGISQTGLNEEKIAASGVIKNVISGTVSNLGTIGLGSSMLATTMNRVVGGAIASLAQTGVKSDSIQNTLIGDVLETTMNNFTNAGLKDISEISIAMESMTQGATGALSKAGITKENLGNAISLVTSKTISHIDKIGVSNVNDMKTIAGKVSKGIMSGLGNLKNDGSVTSEDIKLNANIVSSSAISAIGDFSNKGLISKGDLTSFSSEVAGSMIQGLALAGGKRDEISQIQDTITFTMVKDLGKHGIDDASLQNLKTEINQNTQKSITLAENLQSNNFPICQNEFPSSLTNEEVLQKVSLSIGPNFCLRSDEPLCPALRQYPNMRIEWMRHLDNPRLCELVRIYREDPNLMIGIGAGNPTQMTVAPLDARVTSALPPKVLLANPPLPVSATTKFQLTVNGGDVTLYRFKAGPKATTICNHDISYSAPIAVANPLYFSLEGQGDGEYSLCIIGGNLLGQWQGFHEAYAVNWRKDTSIPKAPALIPAGGIYNLMSSIESVKVGDILAGAIAYYTISTDGFEPLDPDQNSTKLVGDTINGIKSNGITKIKIRQFTDTGMASDIAVHVYHLDLIAPPVLQANMASGTYTGVNTFTSITLANIEAGANVYFTMTIDGSTPPNPTLMSPKLITPVLNGILRNGMTRIKLMQVDAAGNGSQIASYDYQQVENLPQAVLSGFPVGTSAVNNLAVLVGGVNVTQYRYKITTANDCNLASSYSAIIPTTSTLITDSLSSFGDGTIRLCVVAGDSFGNWQSLDAATSVSWTKGSSAINAIINGAPTGSSNAIALNVTVSGATITSYKYKMVQGTNCSLSSGYSNALSIGAAITDSLEGFPEGILSLCVVGINSSGIEQSFSSATIATWTKSNTSATKLAIINEFSQNQVEIYTLQAVNLGGYTLSDQDGNVASIPAQNAAAGSYIVVNLGFQLDSSGDDLLLKDNQGNPIDYVSYGGVSTPPSSLNWNASSPIVTYLSYYSSVSLSTDKIDNDSSLDWEVTGSGNGAGSITYMAVGANSSITTNSSFGFDNHQFVPTLTTPIAGLRFNEISSYNSSIELYVTQSGNTGRYLITNQAGYTFMLPNLTVSAGDFVVISSNTNISNSSINNTHTLYTGDYNFVDTFDDLVLFKPDANDTTILANNRTIKGFPVDYIAFGASAHANIQAIPVSVAGVTVNWNAGNQANLNRNISLAYNVDDNDSFDWEISGSKTAGGGRTVAPNSLGSPNTIINSNPAQVILNEISRNRVELYIATGGNLGGFVLTDMNGNFKTTSPETVTAGQFKVVYLPFQLNSNGDDILLLDPNDTKIDYVSYGGINNVPASLSWNAIKPIISFMDDYTSISLSTNMIDNNSSLDWEITGTGAGSGATTYMYIQANGGITLNDSMGFENHTSTPNLGGAASANIIINEVDTNSGVELYATSSGYTGEYVLTNQAGFFYILPNIQVSAGDYIVIYNSNYQTNNSLNGVHKFYTGIGVSTISSIDDLVLLKPHATQTTNLANGVVVKAVPADYIAFGAATHANIQAIPTSSGGVSTNWSSSNQANLTGGKISLSPNGGGSDSSLNWEISGSGQAGLPATMAPSSLGSTNIYVNSNPADAIINEISRNQVELYITTSGDLGGFVLTDRDGQHKTIPGQMVNAGDFKTIYLDFVLDSASDDLLLLDHQSNPIDYVSYGGVNAPPTGLTWNASKIITNNLRYENSLSLSTIQVDNDTSLDWEVTGTGAGSGETTYMYISTSGSVGYNNSFGYSNHHSTPSLTGTPAGLIINEVNAYSSIELYVTTSGNIGEYVISNQKDFTYILPNIFVNAGEYIVISGNSNTTNLTSQSPYYFYTGDYGVMVQSIDNLVLLKPSGSDTTQLPNGLNFEAIPVDYIAFGAASHANIKPIPNSSNGVTVAWNASNQFNLTGGKISLTPNGIDSNSSIDWEISGSGNASGPTTIGNSSIGASNNSP